MPPGALGAQVVRITGGRLALVEEEQILDDGGALKLPSLCKFCFLVGGGGWGWTLFCFSFYFFLGGPFFFLGGGGEFGRLELRSAFSFGGGWSKKWHPAQL